MQQIDFTQYHYLIIDSSFFISPMDDALCAELGKYCDPSKMPFLCASSTIHSEIRQYLQLLANHPTQLAVYQDNLGKLRAHHIKLCHNNYSNYDNAAGTPRHDTWDLINVLFEDNHDVQPKILLLTANELLLRRIVLSDLPVSIFDLKTKKLFNPAQLAMKKADYELDSDENDEITLAFGPLVMPNPGDTLILFDADKKPIELIHDEAVTNIHGTEGTFFSVKDNPELFAKVYGKDTSTPYSKKIARNIENMKYFHDTGFFPWAVLPEMLLYDSNGMLAGYMMRKLDDHYAPLGQDSRYNQSDNYSAFKDKPFLETIEICLMLLREIAYMSNYDILPVDFGKGNFYADSSDPYIYMLDTCSFCFDRFNSRKCDPGIQSVKFGDSQRAVVSKLALVDLYLEYTHLFVLSLMMLGSDFAYDPDTDSMCFLKEGTHNYELFETLVPQNLQQLYRALFSASGQPGAPFSIEVLIEEMEYALAVVSSEAATYASLGESGGHRGDIHPPRLPDVLPCVYRNTIVVPPIRKAAPVESPCPKYLQRKTPPPVHAASDRITAMPHPTRIGRASIDPLPSVYKNTNTPRKGLFIFLGALVLIMLVVVMDMIRFSTSNLGFSFSLYWEAQMEAFRNFWQNLTTGAAEWFQNLKGTLT